MESIITLYKIGHGPSSSHTMGPANAAKYFKNVYHNADKYKVTLYGSLALTGKGHLTDQAILETLSPIKTEIIWNVRETSIKHPNTMDFEASLNGKVLGSNRFYSIGGGAIQIEGDTTTNTVNSLYKEKNGEEIINLCKTNKWELIDYVKHYESKEF
jgi:L-serine dehydratase